ncbi:hypothetical protein [Frankia sp. Cppng1_Ct_nod]|uniref:hypothetical protein n=1 Tax=Frankia sp. Cppng1_Ct_nod TaxID=2897162 RepID=UPI002025A4C1|nr:hypothetical protein [Frankia sp. Cppng1_Ct_nod]
MVENLVTHQDRVDFFIRTLRDAYDCGFNGRFGAGLLWISDGSMLFLQDMIAKRVGGSEAGAGMTPTTIAMVVKGEVAALPVLLRRMAAKLAPESWVDLPCPYRVGRSSLSWPTASSRRGSWRRHRRSAASGVWPRALSAPLMGRNRAIARDG